MKKDSISSRIVTYSVLPLTAVLLIAAIICVFTLRSFSVASTKSVVKNEVVTVGEKIDTYMNRYISCFELDQTQKIFRQYLNAKKAGTEGTASIVYPRVVETFSRLMNIGQGEIEEIGQEKPVLFFTDNNSDLWVQDSNSKNLILYEKDDFHIQERPWYQKCLENDSYFVTEPYKNITEKKEVVSIILPIKTETGNDLLGVVGVDVYLDKLPEIMENTSFSQTAYFNLVDIDGNVLYLQNDNKIFKRTKERNYIKEIKNVKTGQTKSGTEIYAVKKIKNVDWYLFAVQPMQEINVKMNTYMIPVAIIFIIIIFAMVLVMRRVSQVIVKPILKLQKGIQRIAKGDYSEPILVDTEDEIGDVAKTFNETISELRRKAEFDSLTGIYKQETIYEKAEQMLVAHPKDKFAVLLFNINHFKYVNNMFGRAEGDKILVYLADVLRKHLSGKQAVYGRIKDDIFCCFVQYDKQDELIEFAESTTKKIKGYSEDISLVPSCGIYEISEKAEIRNYIDYANIALEKIKGQAYMHYFFYSNKMHQKINRERQLENEMETALLNDQFIFFLQPKYDMETLKVVGAEALVRWKHPEEGMISPGEFIPLFEKNGFVIKVDEYIWESVCKKINYWMKKGYQLVPISINISRIHTIDPSFVDKLIGLVKKYEIPPKLLELEFTESAFLDGVDELYGSMEKLQESGFRLSMDDFGSGFSSLNMLKNVPLDVVKIDREFINETVATKKGKLIVENTIQLVNKLELDLIAEGVENEKQAQFLLDVGCRIAQGFFYAKPIDVEKFEKLVFLDDKELEVDSLKELRKRKD